MSSPPTHVCVSTPAWLHLLDISIFAISTHSILTHLYSLQHPLLFMLSLSIFATCHPKKGVATGRVSSAATKIALQRATATPQVTAAKLAYQTNRAAASRVRETPQETEARLADQRNGASASRASETPHETGSLAPKHNCVHELNLLIQNMLPTNNRTYKSVDVVMDPSQALLYPLEFLNSLEHTGITPRNLKLKVGVPIILLRNLHPSVLCNGTRLCVKNLYSHLIEATILTGCAKVRDVFIPRLPPILTDLSFDVKRIQFPVRLAFATSINKAQGQSPKIAGIHIQNPSFLHGQLYVVYSRVGYTT